MAKVTTGAAALALGKNRKTLQRWAKRDGCPLGADGLVDVEELRAWAKAQGLLGRGPDDGPRTATERALAEASAVAPAAPEVQKAARTIEALDLDDEGRKFLEALEGDDKAALLRLAPGADPKMVRKLEAVGRARSALADAVKRELDNQVRRRELLPLGDVVAAIEQHVGAAASVLDAMPGKLSPRLVDQPYEAVYALLEDEIAGLRRHLASLGTAMADA